MMKNKMSNVISIVMVSSSIDRRDVDRAQLHAEIADYLTKPVAIEKFRELLNVSAVY